MIDSDQFQVMTVEEKIMQSRYGARDKLGEAWHEKRKATEGAQFLPDGSPNPHYPRLLIETDQARIFYDMAYLLEQNSLLRHQIEMLSSMHQRMGILEGAYSHLMAMAQGVKLEYYAKLKKLVDKKEVS